MCVVCLLPPEIYFPALEQEVSNLGKWVYQVLICYLLSIAEHQSLIPSYSYPA